MIQMLATVLATGAMMVRSEVEVRLAFEEVDALATLTAQWLDAWRWVVVLGFLCVEAWLASLLVFQRASSGAPMAHPIGCYRTYSAMVLSC